MTTPSNMKIFNNKLVTFSDKLSVYQKGWFLYGAISPENCIAAYQAKGAANLAASYVNLANPGTYDLVPSTPVPGWNTVDGWIFNQNSYLDTGITSAVMGRGTGSVLVHLSENMSGGGDVLSGIYGMEEDPFTEVAIELYINGLTTTYKYYYGTSNGLAQSGHLVDAVLAMAGTRAYKNGVDEGTIDTTWGIDIDTASIFIGGSHYQYYSGATFRGSIKSAAFYNTTLTPAQVLAVTTVMKEL